MALFDDLIPGGAAGTAVDDHIAEAADRFGVSPDLIRATIGAESSGRTDAVSPVGAGGLMQLMPDTFQEVRHQHGLGPDRFDPRTNVLAGTAYLRQQLDRYDGDPSLALAAYNAGPGTVDAYRAGRRSLPAETRAYVPRVLGSLHDPADGGGGDASAGSLGGGSLFDDLVPGGAGDDLFADLIPKKAAAPGVLDIVGQGLKRGAQAAIGRGQQAVALVRGRPIPDEDQPQDAVTPYLTSPFDFTSPPTSLAEVGALGKKVLGKTVYGLAETAPELAGAVAGGAAGAATPLPGGAIIGTGVGAGLTHAGLAIAPYLKEELARTPEDADGAWTRALERAGTAGAFTGAGFSAFALKPFAGALKNLAFQALGVQPVIGGAGQAAQNLETGAPVLEGVGQAAGEAAVASAVPAVAERLMHGLAPRRPAPERASAEQEADAATAEEAEAANSVLALPAPRKAGNGFVMGDDPAVRAAQADVQRWTEEMDAVQAALSPHRTEGMTEAEFSALIPTPEERDILVKRWNTARDNYQAARNRVDNLMPEPAKPEGVQPPDSFPPLPPENLPDLYRGYADRIDEAAARGADEVGGYPALSEPGARDALEGPQVAGLLERPRGVVFGDNFTMRGMGDAEAQRVLPKPESGGMLPAPDALPGDGFTMGSRPEDLTRATEISALAKTIDRRTKEMAAIQRQIAKEIDPTERRRLRDLFKKKNAQAVQAKGRLEEMLPDDAGGQPPKSSMPLPPINLPDIYREPGRPYRESAPARALPRPDHEYGEGFTMRETEFVPDEVTRSLPKPEVTAGEGFTMGRRAEDVSRAAELASLDKLVARRTREMAALQRQGATEPSKPMDRAFDVAERRRLADLFRKKFADVERAKARIAELRPELEGIQPPAPTTRPAAPAAPKAPALHALPPPNSIAGNGFMMGSSRPIDVARGEEISTLQARLARRTREMGALQRQVAQEVSPAERERLTALFQSKNRDAAQARARLEALMTERPAVDVREAPPASEPLKVDARTQADAPDARTLDEIFAQKIRDGWSSAIDENGTFISKKYYPIEVEMNGVTRRFAAWKKSGRSDVNISFIENTNYGPVISTYKVTNKGLMSVGQKNLFAFSEEAQRRAIQEFNDLFSKGARQDQQGAMPSRTVNPQGGAMPARPSAPADTLGPMLPPRQSRINPAARSDAALESSLARADETRHRPRQTAEQRSAAEAAKAETLRKFDEAAADGVADWKARSNAERNTRSEAVRPKKWERGYYSTEEMEYRTGWNDALDGRPTIDPEVPAAYEAGVLEARAWLEENPRPAGGETIDVTARTSRGQETRYTLPADADAIRKVRGNIEKLPVDRFSHEPIDPTRLVRTRPSKKTGKVNMGGAMLDAPRSFFDWLEVPSAPLWANYEQLARKHPEWFVTPEDAQVWVERVLSEADEAIPSSTPGHMQVIRRVGDGELVAVDLIKRGGVYNIESAYAFDPHQLAMKEENARQAGLVIRRATDLGSFQKSPAHLPGNSNVGDATSEANRPKGEGDSLRFAPAFEQALPFLQADLRARLTRYGIDDRIGLRLVDMIRDRRTGEPIDGAAGRYGRRVIEVALNARDRSFTFDHEVVHALRDLGLIRPPEWRALQREVLADNARMASVRGRYQEFGRMEGVPEQTDRLIEEAVADLFGEWQAGRVTPHSVSRAVMERIRDFLRAVAQALRGEGFTTVDSVFRAIDRGEVGRRSTSAEAPSGGLAEAFRQDGDQFQRGTPLSAAERSLAESIMAEHPSFAERARKAFTGNRSGMGSEMVRQFVNQFQPIFDAEMRAEVKAGSKAALRDARVSAAKFTEMAVQDSGRLEMMLTAGPLKWNAKEGIAEIAPGIGGLLDIFKSLENPEDYKRFNLYAIARRAQRLAQEGRENLLSPAQIAAGMALETPAFKTVFDGYQRYNKAMLDFAVDTGVIKAASRDLYTKSMDYVPFYRVAEETGEMPGPALLAKLSNPDPKVRKLEGGSEKIGDLAENVIRNATSLAKAGMRNEAMRRIHGILEELGEAKTLTGADEKAGSAAFFDKGVKRHFIADDPALMAALAGLRPEQHAGIYKALAGFSNLLRRGVTASPGFMLANFIRDTASAYVQTGGTLSLANNGLTGLVRAAKKADSVKELKAIAGVGGYEFGHGAGDAAKELKRRLGIEVATTPGAILEKVLRPLEEVGSWTEVANRDAIYRNTLERGGSKAEAAYQALNLLNFSRKGANASLRFMLPLVPFLNARIQGLYRLAETQGNPAALKGVMARGLMLTGLSAALYAAFGDDERAKDEPLERRLNYYIVYPTKDSRVLIPKPFEFGAVFSTMPEFLFDAIAKKDGDDLAKAAAMTLLNTFSFNPIPQAVRPALEAATNYDFFTGRPIEGQAQQKLSPGERADARTSGALKLLGRETNISPMQMEHLIGGYLGTLGQTAIAGFDAILAASGVIPSKPAGAFGSVPILSPVMEQAFGRFYKEGPDAASRWVGDFYDLKHKADETFQTIRHLREEGEVERAQVLQKGNAGLIGARRQLTTMAEQIGDLSQRINAIRGDDEMSPEEKRSRLDALIARRNAIARRTEGVLDSIRKRTAPAEDAD